MKHINKIKKEFLKKFCRENLEHGGYEEKWFLLQYITTSDMWTWIEQKLKQEHQKGRESREGL